LVLRIFKKLVSVALAGYIITVLLSVFLLTPWTWNFGYDILLLLTYEKGFGGHLLTYALIGAVGLTAVFRWWSKPIKAVLTTAFLIAIHEVVWYAWIIYFHSVKSFQNQDFLNISLYCIVIGLYVLSRYDASKIFKMSIAVYICLESIFTIYILAVGINYKAPSFALIDESLWYVLGMGFLLHIWRSKR
jgi:hypothetical protein